jgi:excisionase family DNA binding protein
MREVNLSAVAAKQYSIKAFGALHGVGRTKTYELINSGQLSAVKVGSRTLIPVEAAERWRERLPRYTKSVGPHHDPVAEGQR